YLFFFKVVLFFKKNFCKKKECRFKVLSVGNLSVGGTGKSVFVQFLEKKLSDFSGAIILRGYKSEAEKSGKSFLVSDGKNILLDQEFSGDEAFMLANNVNSPVVIGSDRALSYSVLEDRFKNLDYVLLDDAYQNFKLKKDFEILLLDAKSPLENGHCLPAGKLREKDYSRADVIILTNASGVSSFHLKKEMEKLAKKFDKEKIFAGEHAFSGIYKKDSNLVEINSIKEKKILAFAGIGSFINFEKSLKNLGFNKILLKEYPDHYKYTKTDLFEILNYLKFNLVDILLTTQKDWVKIAPFLSEKEKNNFYVLRVEFNFLEEKFEKDFFNLLTKKIIM
ncbi:tetraacyldisaccharide 4'-kinase, partial [Candidatus Dependentiae bacterium]|nr:tetraacyldisaccharide 4'-kinase [Candidatus Dependentiae bacterium]